MRTLLRYLPLTYNRQSIVKPKVGRASTVNTFTIMPTFAIESTLILSKDARMVDYVNPA